MGSLVETIQKKKRFQLIPSMPYKDDLPISSSSSKGNQLIGIRKRISSFSVNIQPCLANTASSAWAFRKSHSMPTSLGEYFAGVGPLRRWWERSWGWLLSKKPTFARDIEMNEEEMEILGCESKGTLRHLFYKIRRLVQISSDQSTTTTLPITHKFRCDSFGYANNGKIRVDNM